MHKDRAKVVSLFLFLVGLIAILFTDNGAVRTAHGSAFGPVAGHTGAPLFGGGFEPSCTECHSSGFFTGAKFIIDAPTGYSPGQTYQINVTHTTEDETRRRWGFQLTALSSTLNQAGNLQSTSPLTQVVFGGSPGTRQYIEHNITVFDDGTFEGQQFGATWSFNWVAPATDIGPVTFYAAGNHANGNGSPGGDQIYVTQVTVNPINCSYTISPSTGFFSVAGGSGGTMVASAAGCNWTAQSNDSWINLTSSSSGSGNATVTFTVAQNFTAAARTGTLTIAGRTYSVVQDGGLGFNCSYSFAPTSQTFSASGGMSSVTVRASLRCAWQAVSQSSWITVLSGSPGVGDGSVSFQVASNPGPLGRNGTIKIAERTFTVKQKKP